MGSHVNKSLFAVRSLTVFGFKLVDGTIQPTAERIEALNQFPEPNDVSSLRRFLGMISYYRRFIRNYANLCIPFYKLLQKDTDFKFDDKCVKT